MPNPYQRPYRLPKLRPLPAPQQRKPHFTERVKDGLHLLVTLGRRRGPQLLGHATPEAAQRDPNDALLVALLYDTFGYLEQLLHWECGRTGTGRKPAPGQAVHERLAAANPEPDEPPPQPDARALHRAHRRDLQFKRDYQRRARRRLELEERAALDKELPPALAREWAKLIKFVDDPENKARWAELTRGAPVPGPGDSVV